jgi:uncharacterized alpha-E superfamily protein
MLSRVAANLYWASRYIERAEGTARLINVNSHLLLDLPKKLAFGWHPLIEITGDEALFHERYGEASERSVVKFLVGDTGSPGSILTSLQHARDDLRTIRDVIPREAWEQLNELYWKARNEANAAQSSRRRYDYLQAVIAGAQEIAGTFDGTMTHDAGYDFLRLGRHLERADMTSRIIDVRSDDLLPERAGDLTPFYNIQWMSVLKSMSAYQMYRRQVQGAVRRADVLGFLFQDRQFPRAIGYCLLQLDGCLQDLPRNDLPLRHVARLQRLVNEARIEELQQQELHRFIDTLQLELAAIHDQITATYFALPRASRGA